MPVPAIIRGSDHFFGTIYEGNGGGQKVGNFVPFTDSGTIAKSCIFDRASSGRMNVDYTSAGTNTKKCTISLWFKLGNTTTASGNLISAWGGTGYLFQIIKYADNHGSYPSYLMFQHYDGGSYNSQIRPNRSFEDRSKWYHLLYVWDSTESTSSDRVKIYIDGDQITSFSTSSYPSTNDDFVLTDKQSGDNTTVALGTNASQIGGTENQFFDGYLAEVNVVDGSALGPSTFGLTDTSTGRWIPKTLSGITYGSNGSRLTFANTAGLTIGDDTSGNENDFTISNIATTDITTDSPTQNFATLQGTGGTLSEGNLKLVTGNSDYSHHNATLKPTSGKYYAEFTCDSMGRSEVGVVSTLSVPYSSNTTRLPATSDGSVAGYMYYGFNGQVYYNSSNSYDVTYATYTSTDIIGIALDLDNYTVQFFKNNSSQGTISLPNGNYTFVMGDGATGYSGGWTANFGQKSFTYTAPTGFVALQQDNLPSTAKGISGLVWTKNRDSTDSNQLYDSSRGKQLVLASNATTAETTVTDGLQKFLAGGQQIEDSNAINTSGESFVSWNWVANGGTTETNTDGSITSTVQVNTTAGFSIVEWTGDGGQSTVGHGLSGTPKVVIQKRLNTTSDWWFYTTALDGSYDYNKINSTNSFASQSAGSAPTSTTFTSHGWGSSDNMVAYVFHEVEGYSKISSYTGNGVADGPFVYTGFRPAFIIFKANRAANWYVHDSTRSTFNPVEKTLYWSLSNAEGTGVNGGVDFLSNGFKVRQPTGYGYNNSGVLNLYMAFAEHPFVGNGTSPVTAK